MTVGEELQVFVEAVVREVVDVPEQVRSNLLESANTVVVELEVDPSDVGKVIGREGRMADAIRILLTGVSTKLGKKAILQVMDP
ncbi:MAG: KH domain-containing protein [Pseudomonadota bacterium]